MWLSKTRNSFFQHPKSSRRLDPRRRQKTENKYTKIFNGVSAESTAGFPQPVGSSLPGNSGVLWEHCHKHVHSQVHTSHHRGLFDLSDENVDGTTNLNKLNHAVLTDLTKLSQIRLTPHTFYTVDPSPGLLSLHQVSLTLDVRRGDKKEGVKTHLWGLV